MVRLVLIGLWLASPSLLADEFTLSGEPRQGAILLGSTAPGNQVYLGEQEVRVSDSGRFVLGFDRDAPQHLELTVRDQYGVKQRKYLDVEPREYEIQRIDGLPPSSVTPPAEVLERIRTEAARVSAARKRDDAREDFTETFVWPAQGPISGVYGSQRILNGEPRRPHYGVDVAAPAGAPVIAPAGGIVTLAEDDLYYSGGTVILDHGHGLSSSFLHLQAVHVEVGQRLEQGDAIGEVGAGGRATGPHLDWRMNWHHARVDPQTLVSGLPE